MQTQELPEIVDLYRTATIRALAAGFDGVEVLAAGGYLLDHFLQNETNLRTDVYTAARSRIERDSFWKLSRQ